MISQGNCSMVTAERRPVRRTAARCIRRRVGEFEHSRCGRRALPNSRHGPLPISLTPAARGVQHNAEQDSRHAAPCDGDQFVTRETWSRTCLCARQYVKNSDARGTGYCQVNYPEPQLPRPGRRQVATARSHDAKAACRSARQWPAATSWRPRLKRFETASWTRTNRCRL